MADSQIRRIRNTYDTPDTPLAITLNTATYVKLLDVNKRRIGYKVTNDSPHNILVRENITGDELDRGFMVFKKSVYESKVDNVPVGEVWAKAITGAPLVLTTEE